MPGPVYSPNPSPLVPDPPSLQPQGPTIRPPTIPSHPPSQPGPPAPGWTQPQHQAMNAFPQGYPTHTPYAPYAHMGHPTSYYNPPVVLPQNVPPTPEVPVGANGFSNDWVGPTSGWNPAPLQTPFNGPQPHTGFSAFQQPLPGGPPAPVNWGPPPGALYPSTPAAWHQPPPAGPPGGWGPQPPSAGPWPHWSGMPPSAGAHTPWAGWPIHQAPPPPVVPQPAAAPAYRDRSNEGLDKVEKFAVGTGYGPVLTPLLLRIVNAKLTINPLLSPPDTDLDNDYLKWNMLFSASHCVRSDDPPQRSWSRGRPEPATYPKLTELKIISKTFPWTITVHAVDDNVGVTCGEVIDRLDDFLHKNVKKGDADLDSPAHAAERNAAYHHNRSTAIGVPGGRLGEGLRRLDWLCRETMFGGLMMDEAHCHDAFCTNVPGVVSLICTTMYPLTEQEMEEQEAREKEEENFRERLRMLELREAEAEAMLRQQKRSRSGSSRNASRSASRSASRAGYVQDCTDEDDDNDN